jgi:drug/metabolite transporter (DMT)-like permease
VVTVGLAFLLFDESLSGPQLAGAALVLLAAVAVRTPLRAPALRPSAAPGAA